MQHYVTADYGLDTSRLSYPLPGDNHTKITVYPYCEGSECLRTVDNAVMVQDSSKNQGLFKDARDAIHIAGMGTSHFLSSVIREAWPDSKLTKMSEIGSFVGVSYLFNRPGIEELLLKI